MFDPGSNGVRFQRARCARPPRELVACPKVNSRKKIPSVEAHTPRRTLALPPVRSTFTSSMQSAPQIIPAMMELSFPPHYRTERPEYWQIHMLADQFRKTGLLSSFSTESIPPPHEIMFVEHRRPDCNVYDDCTELPPQP